MSVVANVAINVDSRGATQKLREVQNQAQQTERAFGGITAATGKLAIAFGAIQAAKFIFVKTAELESQTKSLEVLTGSAEKAGQIIKELQQLGAVTPFTSTELIDSAKRLQAFGVEADKVVETTKRLADVSGATGAELQGLVTAYGQVQAKGRLQGEELLQFQERGVALQEELRKMYGLSGEELQRALSKGRISAEAVEVAIIRLTDVGGKYANGAIAQSDTLSGKWSTLVDGVEALAKTIGNTLKPALKEIFNLAIAVVDQVNKALGGPEYKQANDQLFNTRARIKELKEEISAAEKAGVGLAAGMQVKGIDGQVLGGGQPVLPGMKFELQQLEKQAASLEKRLKDLRIMSKAKQQTKPSAIPDLLPEDAKQKKGRQLSVDDLLGGDIQRQLREAQARLQAATQANLNIAAQQPNAEQAQRIVKSTSKLLNIKYQIDAIDKTITGREQVRAQIIANSTDKAYAALAFDEQTSDLKSARVNLEREIDQILLEQLGKAEAQYRQEQQAIKDALSGLDMEVIKLQAKGDAGEAAIKYLEIENQLKEKGVNLSNQDKEAIRLKIADIQKLTKEQEAANAKLQMEKDLYDSISSTIAGAFSGAIDAAVKGTESLGDALKGLAADVAATIGKMLIMYGIAQALGALGGSDGVGVFSFLAKGFGFKGAKDGAYWPGGFQAFADGGMVTKPTMGLIGEGGEPEYVIPASKMRGAMSRYAAGTRGSAVIPGSGSSAEVGGAATATMAPIDVRYSIERINNVDYVTADQFQRGMAQAAQQGAIQGERRAMRSLKNSAATRRGVGI